VNPCWPFRTLSKEQKNPQQQPISKFIVQGRPCSYIMGEFFTTLSRNEYSPTTQAASKPAQTIANFATSPQTLETATPKLQSQTLTSVKKSPLRKSLHTSTPRPCTHLRTPHHASIHEPTAQPPQTPLTSIAQAQHQRKQSCPSVQNPKPNPKTNPKKK
jgi:hypothetical protein